uniref:Uncharacterized protein n=1 Tax=Anguilla anguilla TaxID=7936 RepID=A0A0E9R7Y3_ANGAN
MDNRFSVLGTIGSLFHYWGTSTDEHDCL